MLGVVCFSLVLAFCSAQNIAIQDIAQVEGSTNTFTTQYIPITVTPPHTSDITLSVSTLASVPLSARTNTVNGNFDDYTAVATSIVIPANTATYNVPVQIFGDNPDVSGTKTDVDTETFRVQISSASAGTITKSMATWTIINDDGAIVWITDYLVTEPDTGSIDFVFEATIRNGVYYVTNIEWTMFHLTTSAADVGLTNGFLYWPPFSTVNDPTYVNNVNALCLPNGCSTTVSIFGDNVYEGNEAFNISLFNPGAAIIDQGRVMATVTIVENDPIPSFVTGDISILEGQTGTNSGTMTITMNPLSAFACTVDWTLQPGTATTPSDYVSAVGGTLSYPPGTATRTVTVTVNGDSLNEANEVFNVVLSNPQPPDICKIDTPSGGKAIGVVTITNDDASIISIVASASVSEGNAPSNPTVTLTLSLDFPSSSAITVLASTGPPSSGFAATAGTDYTALSGFLVTFPALSTSATLTVTVIGDSMFENNEAFSVSLSSPVGASISASAGSATVTINNDDSVPSISVSSTVSVAENAGPASLTVTLTNPTINAVTVPYTMATGTAGAADFTSVSSSLVIAAGSLTGTISVTLNNDNIVEPSESFTVTLGTATNGNITPGAATCTVTITNDDSSVLNTVDLSQNEGNSGTPVWNVGVTLSQPFSVAVTITYYTSSTGPQIICSNTLGYDIVCISSGSPSTVTLAAGATTGSLGVTVRGDTFYENGGASETFSVVVASATSSIGNPTISKGTAVVTIVNDDSVPSLTLASRSANEGASGTVTATFPCVLSNAGADTSLSVDIVLAGGTATLNNDFAVSSATVTWGAFRNTCNLNSNAISFFGDTMFEPDETISVTLQNPVGLTTSGANPFTYTITNDDLTPTVSIAGATVNEGASGNNVVVTLTITASAASYLTMSMSYASSSGTATTADSDFLAASGTATISAGGATTTSVTVTVVGDDKFETTETFTVSLSGYSNCAAGASPSATVTITNDDASPSVSLGDVAVTETNTNFDASLPITLSNPSYLAVICNVFTAGTGTATAGSDFTARASGSYSVSIASGSTSGVALIQILGETTYEAAETVDVSMTVTNGVLADGAAVITIGNDDPLPTVTIASVSVAEGNSGSTTVTLTVSLSNPSAFATSVVYTATNGGATAPADFTNPGATTLNIAANAVSATFTYTIIGETLYEDDESFTVTLSSPSGLTLGGSPSATVTITNDDILPTISISDSTANEGSGADVVRTLTVTLSNPNENVVTFAVNTADGTATAASGDYVAIVGGSGSIAAGSTTTTITVTVVADNVVELNDAFQVVLSSVVNANSGGGSDLSSTVTITNDDTAVVTINDISVNELTGSSASGSLTISLSNPSDYAISMSATTSDGTAESATDYTSFTNQGITFTPRTVSMALSVSITGDNVYENSETFTVTLSSVVGATLTGGDATGVVTIVSDDALPTVSVAGASFAEGTASNIARSLTVTLSHPTQYASSVQYATSASGDASPGEDFTAVSPGTVLSIPALATSASLPLVILADNKFENDEDFSVTISNAVGLTIGSPSTVTVVIQNDEALPSCSVYDVSVTEPNTSPTTATAAFRLALSHPSEDTVTVTFSTVASGTATAGTDFTTVTGGTVTFNPTVVERTIDITVLGDNVVEADETFEVSLTTSVNANIVDGSAIGTIVNDDATSVSMSATSYNEGSTGPNAVSFVLSLSRPSVAVVTVDLTTADGTAVGGSDYTAVSTPVTLSFASLATTTSYLFTLSGDTMFEDSESFSVSLSNPTGATITTPSTTVTITNDDAFPSMSIADSSANEGSSGSASRTLTVTLSNPSENTVSAVWSTVDGTASAVSGDFTGVTVLSGTTVTFSPGSVSETLSVTINGDDTHENTESFAVVLSSPSGATILDASATVTLVNDDAVPTVSVVPRSATEGTGGAGSHAELVTLQLTNPRDVSTSVFYATSAVSATADVDFTSVPPTVVLIPAMATSITVSVTILHDTIYEASEVVSIVLSSPNLITLGSNGDLTVVDDDLLPTVSIADAYLPEGTNAAPSATVSRNVAVSLSNPSAFTITVDFATSDGTAVAGTDYVATAGTLTFTAGVTTMNVVVLFYADLFFEPTEDLAISLSSPSGAVIGDGVATVSMYNDDGSLISIAGATVTEGDSGSATVNVVVTLAETSIFEALVDYATVAGTASAGSDYTAFSGRLSIPAGELSHTFVLTYFGDTTFELDETLQVVLSNPFNCVFLNGLDPTALVTITNDDPQPTISIGDVSVTEGTAGSGSTTATLTLSLTNPSYVPVTVEWTTSTSGGSASHGSDVAAASGTVTWPPGSVTQTISLNLVPDIIYEADETLSVELSSPTGGASIGDASATVTILNDDPVPTVTYSVPTVTEGSGPSPTTPVSVVLTLSNPSAFSASLTYATVDGTATAGSGGDYTAVSTTALVFDPLVTSRTLTFSVLTETVYETDEAFTVAFDSPVGLVLGGSSTTVTINNDDPVPAVSIDSRSVNEGTASNTVVTFTLTLTNPHALASSVDVVTVDGSATAADGDYLALPTTTLTFPPLVTTLTVDVTFVGDNVYEDSEAFTVVLGSPVGITIGAGTGTATLVADDPLPTATIDDIAFAELDSGSTTRVFTVTLSNPSESPSTVVYSTADGGASAGAGDYTAISATVLTVPALASSATIGVAFLGDTVREDSEDFFVDLVSPVGMTLGNTRGRAVIGNDDPIPTVTVSGTTVSEGNSGSSLASVTIALSNPSENAITLVYSTVAGSAVAPSDFVGVSGATVVLAPGSTATSVAVTIVGEVVFEDTEQLTVTFSTSSEASFVGGASIATLTITNDDAQPVLSVADLAFSEGTAASGLNSVSLTVSLTNPSDRTMTVDYETVHVTSDDSDLIAVAPAVTLTIPPYASSASVTIGVVRDNVREDDETFSVTLSNPTECTVSTATALLTIQNDDAVPTVVIGDLAASEGGASTSSLQTFTVTVDHPAEYAMFVSVSSVDGTATSANGDYSAFSGVVLTIPPFSYGTTGTVEFLGDDIYELTETFSLSLSNPVDLLIGDGVAVVTIVADDPLPAASLSSLVLAENEGAAAAQLFLSLDRPSAFPVVVALQSSDGTATAGSDYVAVAPGTTVTVAPFAMSQAVSFSLLDENVYEDSETFDLVVSAPSGATIAVATGVVTITNDDAVPTASLAPFTAVEQGSGSNPSYTRSVVLSNPSKFSAAVSVEALSGTAVSGSDFAALSQTLLFTPLQVSADFAVVVYGDNTYENDEAFTLQLFDGSGLSISMSEGTVSVALPNDDPLPAISIADSSANEGGSATTTVRMLAVSLSNPADRAITFVWETVDGTAEASNGDYTAVTSTVATFPAHTTSLTLSVDVAGDNVVEPNEVFTVFLSSPTEASLADATSTLTIVNDDTAVLSIGDVTANEGTGFGSTTQHTVTVSLSNPTVFECTVLVSSVAGTAAGAAEDFMDVTNHPVTFEALTTSVTFEVTVVSDDVYELDEAFSLLLSSPTDCTLSGGDATATVTIVSDEPLPTVSVAALSITEGGAASGLQLTAVELVLSHPSAYVTSVHVSTSSGDATPTEDYLSLTNALVSFPALITSSSAFLAVRGDDKYENAEDLTVSLSSPTGLVISPSAGSAVITLVNDDPVPTIDVESKAVLELNGAGSTVYTVRATLSNPTEETSSFVVSSTHSTTGSSDLIPLVNVVYNLAPEVMYADIVLTVLGDTVFEADEEVALILSSPVNVVLGIYEAFIVITNDDNVPTLTVADATVTEGDSGSQVVNLVLSLSNMRDTPITGSYSTSSGDTATPGVDFDGVLAAPFVIPARTLSISLPVTVHGDVLVEGNEAFRVTVHSVTGGVIGDGEGLVSVTDDDISVVTIADVTVAEGDSGITTALVRVSVDKASVFSTTFNYRTLPGAFSVANVDYTAVPVTAGSISPLTFYTDLILSVAGETIYEQNETVLVLLDNLLPSAYTSLSDASATVTITNDDPYPALSIQSIVVSEGLSGTAAFAVTVSLSNPSYLPVSVFVSTSDGSAASLSDYQAISSLLLSFTPETQSVTTFFVNVYGDNVYEADETFNVTLSGALNAATSVATGTVSIPNDDGVPVVSTAPVSVTEGDDLTVLLSLSNPSAFATSVVLSTVESGTALSEVDYRFRTTTVVFPALTTAASPTFFTYEDTIYEGDEDYTIVLSSPSGLAVHASLHTALVTIVEDDPIPCISAVDNNPVLPGIPSFGIFETNSGTQYLAVDLTLTNRRDEPISVTYSLSSSGGGTASSGSDYSSSFTGVVTFPAETGSFLADSLVQRILVPVLGDVVYEYTETFFLLLSSPVRATICTPSTMLTIVENDALPILSIDSVTVTEGSSGGTTTVATLTVSLSADAAVPVSLSYATRDDVGIATAAVDYVRILATPLNFLPFVRTMTVTALVAADTDIETDESFVVELTAPVNAAISSSASRGVVSIINDDGPQLFVTTSPTAEGNANTTTTLMVRVSGTQVSPFEIRFSYQTSPGSATAGTGSSAFDDYVPVATAVEVIMAPNTLFVDLPFVVFGDAMYEGDETFVLELSNAIGATLAVGAISTVVVIANDDAVPVASVVSPSFSEGNSGFSVATVTVSLSNPSAVATFVVAATASSGGAGPATEFADYQPLFSQTLSFAPGATTASFSIVVFGDTVSEGDETFSLVLSGPSGLTLSGSSNGLFTIVDDDAQPTISLPASVVALEDAGGGAPIAATVLVVSLSNPTAAVVSGTLTTTASGKALDLVDFVGFSDSFTIAAGQLSFSKTMLIYNDAIYEGAETFTVTLSGVTNAVVLNAVTTVTITDSESLPTATLTDSLGTWSSNEGTSGQASRALSVVLSTRSDVPISITWGLRAIGSATPGFDYVDAGGVLTFPAETGSNLAGSLTQTFSFLVEGDEISEPHETLEVFLHSPVNVVAGSDRTFTIVNDDDLPVVSVLSLSVVEGTLANSTANVFLSLSRPSEAPVDVFYSVSGVSALSGTDFVHVPPSFVTFTPYSMGASIAITIVGDVDYEPSETLVVSLTSATAGRAVLSPTAASATVTIVDDDARSIVSVDSISVAEGASGTNVATVTVRLDRANIFNDVVVSLRSVDGTAVAGSDYVALPGGTTVTIATNSLSASVAVTLNGDLNHEADETVSIEAFAATNADLAVAGGAVGTLTILNDDAVPVVTVGSVSVSEAATVGVSAFATVAVTLGTTSYLPVSVTLVTSPGTAEGGGIDYVDLVGPTAATVVLPAGTTAASVSLEVIGDNLYEGSEAFYVDVLSVTGGTTTGPSSRGTVSVTSSNALPALSVSDAAVPEGSGTLDVSHPVTVTLSHPSAFASTVLYSTSVLTASANDYTPLSFSVLSFPAGSVTATVSVTPTADDVYEVDESFGLVFSNGVGLTLADPSAVIVITNDDPLPTISVSSVSVSEAAASTAQLIVSLSHPSQLATFFRYSTVAGTASGGSDYVTATNVRVDVVGLATTATIVVPLLDDTVYEGAEEFSVVLTAGEVGSGLVVVSGPGSSATVAVSDDESMPFVWVSPAAALESAGSVSVMLSTNRASVVPCIVTLSTADVPASTTEAVAGTDYAATSVVVTVSAGSTSAAATIAILADELVENHEVFRVSLASASNCLIAGNAFENVTITDDDVATLTVSAPSPAVEPALGDSATYYVLATLSKVSEFDTVLAYSLASGSNGYYGASVGADFEDLPGGLPASVVIPAGSTAASLPVTLLGDNMYELDETFSVVASVVSGVRVTLSGGAATLAATVTIPNKDPVPTLVTSNVTAIEGNGTVSVASFSLTLSNPSYIDLPFTYTVYSSSGIPVTSTVTIDSGSTAALAPVAIAGNNRFEDLITLGVVVEPVIPPSSGGGGGGGGGGSTSNFVVVPESSANVAVFVVNDDPVPVLSCSGTTALEGEGGALFSSLVTTLTLSNPSAFPISMRLTPQASAKARANVDFIAVPVTVTFLPDVMTMSLTLTIADDDTYEGDEQFSLLMSDVVGVTVPPAVEADLAALWIVDNDPEPTVTWVDPNPVLGNVPAFAIAEGLGATASYKDLWVVLSNPADAAITLSYRTEAFDATPDEDYASIAGVLTFPPELGARSIDSTRQVVRLTVFADALSETNEAFAVVLENPNGPVALAGSPAESQTITIIEVSALPVLSLSPTLLTVDEGAAATVHTFTVSMSSASEVVVTVAWSLSSSDATAGIDYVAASGTLVFHEGDLVKAVTVTVLADVFAEYTETLVLLLSEPSGAVLANTAFNASLVIDDDDGPTLFIGDLVVTEGSPAGSVSYDLNVTTSYASALPFSFLFRTVGAETYPLAFTARSGEDFLASSRTVNVEAGLTFYTVQVGVNMDGKKEADETFALELVWANGANLDSKFRGIITVTDDDPMPTVSAEDVSVVEGDSGLATATITVSLSNPSAFPVSVGYQTLELEAGGAVEGVDYVSATGTVTVPPEALSATFTVSLRGDTTREPVETFAVSFISVTHGVLATEAVTVSILNDDSTQVRASDVAVVEGNTGLTTAFINVTLSAPSSLDVALIYWTNIGSAVVDDEGFPDFVPIESASTFIPASSLWILVPVEVVGDTLFEPDELFFVSFQIAGLQDDVFMEGVVKAGVTIEGDDDLPYLSVANVTVSEGSAATAVSFAIYLTNPSSSSADVWVQASSRTATEGVDFLPFFYSVSIGQKEDIVYVTLYVVGDEVHESDEIFAVELVSTPPYGPAGAILSANSVAYVTIANDDDWPVLSRFEVNAASGPAARSSGALPRANALAFATSDGAVLEIEEGDAGSEYFAITCWFDRQAADPIDVTWIVSNVTASGSVDFVAGWSVVHGTVTYPSTSWDIDFAVIGDVVDEPVESFNITFMQVSGAQFMGGASTFSLQVIIVDDDGNGNAGGDDGVVIVPEAPPITIFSSNYWYIFFCAIILLGTTAYLSIKFITEYRSLARGGDGSCFGGTTGVKCWGLPPPPAADASSEYSDTPTPPQPLPLVTRRGVLLDPIVAPPGVSSSFPPLPRDKLSLDMPPLPGIPGSHSAGTFSPAAGPGGSGGGGGGAGGRPISIATLVAQRREAQAAAAMAAAASAGQAEPSRPSGLIPISPIMPYNLPSSLPFASPGGGGGASAGVGGRSPQRSPGSGLNLTGGNPTGPGGESANGQGSDSESGGGEGVAAWSVGGGAGSESDSGPFSGGVGGSAGGQSPVRGGGMGVLGSNTLPMKRQMSGFKRKTRVDPTSPTATTSAAPPPSAAASLTSPSPIASPSAGPTPHKTPHPIGMIGMPSVPPIAGDDGEGQQQGPGVVQRVLQPLPGLVIEAHKDPLDDGTPPPVSLDTNLVSGNPIVARAGLENRGAVLGQFDVTKKKTTGPVFRAHGRGEPGIARTGAGPSGGSSAPK